MLKVFVQKNHKATQATHCLFSKPTSSILPVDWVSDLTIWELLNWDLRPLQLALKNTTIRLEASRTQKFSFCSPVGPWWILPPSLSVCLLLPNLTHQLGPFIWFKEFGDGIQKKTCCGQKGCSGNSDTPNSFEVNQMWRHGLQWLRPTSSDEKVQPESKHAKWFGPSSKLYITFPKLHLVKCGAVCIICLVFIFFICLAV